MIEIFAVQPPRGRVVHLHSPGYKPSERERPQRDVEALCAAPIWPNGDPVLERRLTPLADALKWTSLRPSDADPRPSWRWCRHCLGHAATLADVVDHVLYLIVQATTPCSCAGRRWVRDEGYQAEFPEDAVTPLRPYKGVIPCGSCNEDGDADPVGDEPW